ncbi:hypothetical protein [Dyella mobilis]|uniref:Uncharacterized protein n=1 Tax=Dyella mobilis TaxID=1849582 RepID=A0ABS2KM95_9GAMM|nr:hypothetical protein [Dyella mobilis]MBM7132276.1 hypothetical protein [Dyella mobilis]GLQ95739.1 hypothetical protein GCM10007863_01570 [Dyella mobilis]
MEELWFLLAFAAVALATPILNSKMGAMGWSDELEASFAEQDVTVDDVNVPASELTVLHRAPGGAVGGRSGVVAMDAQWLCRYGHDVYLLAIAQGASEEGLMVIRWSWRRLTEERARHSLLNDPKAYRAVFGDGSDRP